ncbi:MAG TPA: hypothetical protein DDY32_17560 [Desulfobulbaceae bacterium]|nr:hypothetical protein [Desulfobulbaceae bacterium]
MMKKRLGLKKIIARITGKKPARNAYAKTEVRIHAGPEDQSRFQARRYRLANLKKRFLARKSAQLPEGYGRPAGRKSPAGMYAGFVLLTVVAVALFWGVNGPERLYKGIQSIAFFKVGDVEISGCRMVSKDKLQEASGIIPRQTSLIGLNTVGIEAQLSTVHWVKRAVVRRDWPSTVRITIEENVPVAILNTPGSQDAPLHYIDMKGAQVMPVIHGADVDFPVVTGLMELADEQQRAKSLAEVLAFLKKVGNNDPHLPAQSISEIHVNQVGEIVVHMVEYPFPIFFGSGNTNQKYSRLVQVLRSLYKKPNAKELLSQIEYIQMDYLNDKVLVAQGGSG